MASVGAVTLVDRFRERAGACDGRVGAVLIGSEGQEVLALDADGVYAAASVIKLPLVMTLYEDVKEGRISLEERLPIGERVGGSGVLRELVDVSAMSVRDLAVLTMEVSDNTATNHLIDRVGADRVHERLRSWGCTTTALRRKLFDDDARARGLENVMTPRETAALLRRVRERAGAGDEASARVLRLLEGDQNTQRLGSFLPRGVVLAHKEGWLSDPEPVENDAGIVRARESVVAVGFTHGVHPVAARPLLGLLGLAAAELAGADLGGLPSGVLRGA
ncbi:MAG: serine hydrolase [Chloroflexota bacterium]|nr:serine hydrolase [Chloroflexota bacterium]